MRMANMRAAVCNCLVFYQYDFSLWFADIFCTLISNYNIFLKAYMSILEHIQSGFNGKDLAYFQLLIWRVSVFFPLGTKQGAAIMCDASKLMAECMQLFRITRVSHNL